MKFHIFHNWSPWSDAQREGTYIVQFRFCKICRKGQKRIVH